MAVLFYFYSKDAGIEFPVSIQQIPGIFFYATTPGGLLLAGPLVKQDSTVPMGGSEMRFLGSASGFPHVQGMFREYFLMGDDSSPRSPPT